ncbi:armadillo-type protein [Phlyctochytrium arcticum]|nr:armadillo-type protein [Phlyctochytrium arcticum]
MSHFDRRNGGGGGYRDRHRGGPPRRQRYEDSIPPKSPDQITQERITKLLFTLNDADQPLLDNAYVSRILAEFENHSNVFQTIFKECITQVPHKVGIYGTLTALLSALQYEKGAVIVEMACQSLQESLDKGDFRMAKQVLRYLCELSNASIVEPKELMSVFDLLLSVMDETDVAIQRADAFVYIVLASIPWAAHNLYENLPNELDQSLARVESYMNARRAGLATNGIENAMEALRSYRNVPNDKPYPTSDRLEILWRQIIQLKQADEWEVKILQRPSDDFEAELSGQRKHALPTIKIPTQDNVLFSYQPVFRVFDDSIQGPENAIIRLPTVSSISRFVLEDLVRDIITIFSHNHPEVTRMTFDLEHFLNATYLRDGKFNYLASAVETILAELFRLPRGSQRSVYYATLLMDFVKEDLQNSPRILGRAIRTLFSRLDGDNLGGGMDVEDVRRFSEWFAIHLSNFDFRWKWEDWEPVLSVEPDSACFVFVRETLESCVRLSYWERIHGSVPESFAKNPAVMAQSAPHSSFKFDSVESVPAQDQKLFVLITELRTLTGQKTSSEVVEDALRSIREHAATLSTQTNQSAEDITREALIQCLMLHGSKSFSHALNIIERYVDVLRQWSGTEEARLHSIRIIVSFWQFNHQFLEIILDKLMNYRVVDPKSILSWALDPKILDENYTRFFLWSIVRMTLAKVNFKVQQITKKLEVAKEIRMKEEEDVKMDVPKEEDDVKMDVDTSGFQQMDENRQNSLREQKEAFLHVFQRFVDAIQAKFTEFGTQGVDPSSSAWTRWVLGNMREIARAFPEEIQLFKVTLDMVIFVEGVVDARILKVWQEIKSVYAIHTSVLS